MARVSRWLARELPPLPQNLDGDRRALGGRVEQRLCRREDASPTAVPNQEAEWAPAFDDDLRPLIPEGEYSVVCTKTSSYHDARYKREVVVLEFRVAEGPYAGTQLQRFHAASSSVRRGSVYLREWVIANNGHVPQRLDRLWPSKFRGKLFLARVRTVTKAWDGGNHAEGLRYSKIAAIVELLVSNEVIQ